jgi:hypothetical protein
MSPLSSPPASQSSRTALELERLEQRHRALLGEIEGLGLTLRGSLVTTLIRCGKTHCACHTDKAHRHGPYHLWTRKVAGKTVTVRLTDDQLPRYREWIANMHRLDRLVTQLQELGLEAARAIQSEDRPANHRRRRRRVPTPDS